MTLMDSLYSIQMTADCLHRWKKWLGITCASAKKDPSARMPPMASCDQGPGATFFNRSDARHLPEGMDITTRRPAPPSQPAQCRSRGQQPLPTPSPTSGIALQGRCEGLGGFRLRGKVRAQTASHLGRSVQEWEGRGLGHRLLPT